MWKVLFCAILVLGLCHGAKETRGPRTQGVGAYAYQDSTGNRYGGTYGLKDGQVYNRNGDEVPPFFAGNFAGNNDEAINNFFPEYFRNFENILQDSPRVRRHIIVLPHVHVIEPLPPLRPLLPLPPLQPLPRILPPLPRILPPLPPLLPLLPPLLPPLEPSEIERTALPSPLIPDLPMSHHSHSHFLHTHGRFAPPPYNPGFHGFQGSPGSPGFNGFGAPNFDNFGPNSAFAFGALGPDFSHQIAAINPKNPAMENINVMNRFADVEPTNRGGFKSVSSSSFSSSKNINGRQENQRSASTIINDNGKVTKYEVHGGS